MEQYFSKSFEDVRHESSPTFLLSLVEPDNIEQFNFTDKEVSTIKDFGLEKIFHQ